jgi:NADPH-dependent 2,4-dienoyl-CoA reductase/sulfur reductase-like enzyme/rhodanese-related sulfurtransferase/nitrogen-specific signal transduction histidine kinase
MPNEVGPDRAALPGGAYDEPLRPAGLAEDRQGEVAQQADVLRLATDAAHQLKAPLATVQTILTTLMGGFAGRLEPRQRSLLEKAYERCDSGIKLVRDLMKLRAIERVSDDTLGAVDMGAVMAAVLERFRDAAAGRTVALEFQTDLSEPDSAWVHGQAGLLLEVVSVLVDNAIKYTPSGGHVTTRLYRDDGGSEEPGLVVIEVVDTGIGIPAEGYSRLFAEFYRAPNAKQLSTEGSGLGLAFALRAARRLGGNVTVEPSATGGVCARVSFPFCPECVDRMATGPASAEEASRSGDEAVSQRFVIVGGVTTGSRAAARLLRLDAAASVTIIERGRFLAYAGWGLPYYVSGIMRKQRRLTETALGGLRDSSFSHALRALQTLELTEAVAIDRKEKKVRVRDLIEGTERDLPYDKLLLATGSRPVVPDIAGRGLAGIYTLHGVEDAEALSAELGEGRVKDVVIVGGGRLGCQITEAVALRGSRITLVDGGEVILPALDPEIGALVQRHLERHGVRVVTSARVTGFAGDSRVEAVMLEDGRRLACDFALLATGIAPQAGLAGAAGLAIGASGAVAVDRTLRTSDPDIFAAGDCAEHSHLVAGAARWMPGAAAAAVQGRIAASNMCGGDDEYPGSVGTRIIKLFDATVAWTGLTEQQSWKAGFQPATALVPGLDRAHFVPEVHSMVLKLVGDRRTRRLLGVQAFGTGGVDKRIDVAATALTAGLRIEDLSRLSLAYAPPYSMAIDVLIAGANVLRNKLDGQFRGITACQLRERLAGAEPPLLLDVRLPSEFGVLRLQNSLHVPLAVLRSRIADLPRDRSIVLVCKVGLRSYEASLILKARGFADVWGARRGSRLLAVRCRTFGVIGGCRGRRRWPEPTLRCRAAEARQDGSPVPRCIRA